MKVCFSADFVRLRLHRGRREDEAPTKICLGFHQAPESVMLSSTLVFLFLSLSSALAV